MQVRQILILLLVLNLAACVRDKPYEVVNEHGAGGSVYIVCEGNLGSGGGTLYNYNSTTQAITGDIFTDANNQPLGDVFQSMVRMGDSLYLSVNNSDKIVVINAINYRLAGTISLPKPRYILPVSRNKAFVSTLYSNKVYIIDPLKLNVTTTIDLPFSNPEGMCLWDNKVIICPWDTAANKCYIAEAQTGTFTGNILLPGHAPHAVLTDKQGMLWIMSGNITKGRQAWLSRIDPSTGNKLISFSFPLAADPIKPVFNNTQDTLYFIEVKQDGSTTHNGIYRMSIYDTSLPETPFIQAEKYQYFWSLGIEPVTGNIFVGDPKGFIQKGIVNVYRPEGSLINTFKVGLGPGQFYFSK